MTENQSILIVMHDQKLSKEERYELMQKMQRMDHVTSVLDINVPKQEGEQ